MLTPELAIDADGEPFEVPPHIAGWRIRLLQAEGPGRPELVHDDLGRPIVLPIAATFLDLRNAAGPGRYRLDPIDASGKLDSTVKKACTGYVQPVEPAKEGDGNAGPRGKPAASQDAAIDAMVEMARSNVRLVETVVNQIPAIMAATAELIHAADGAKITARKPPDPPPTLFLPPPPPEADDEDENEDDEEFEDVEPAPQQPGWLSTMTSVVTPMLSAMLAKVGPQILAKIGSGGSLLGGMPLAAILDWSKAIPAAEPTAPADEATRSEPVVETPRQEPEPAPRAAAPQAISGNPMGHLMKIFQQLAPEEQRLAQALIGQMSNEDRERWIAYLAGQPLPVALDTVRRVLGAVPSDNRDSASSPTAAPISPANKPARAAGRASTPTVRSPVAAPVVAAADASVQASPVTIDPAVTATAAPVAAQAAPSSGATESAPANTDKASTKEADEVAIQAATENHLLQVWSGLSDEDRADLELLMRGLGQEQLAEWGRQLLNLPVPDAQTWVRHVLANLRQQSEAMRQRTQHADQKANASDGTAAEKPLETQPPEATP